MGKHRKHKSDLAKALMDKPPRIDIDTVNVITRMLDKDILTYPADSKESICLMKFMQRLSGDEMPESKDRMTRVPIPKVPPTLEARAVALMTDQQHSFAYVTIPSAYPGTPPLFRLSTGDLYVAGPSGGGGDTNNPNSPSLLVPGHPEIQDGYVKAAIPMVEAKDVILL
jgi:hypothetical protein